MRRRRASKFLSDEKREYVIAFLREWLPDEAIHEYRCMIREDPHNWWRHTHFSTNLVVEHALRGNGIDERFLGVADLTPLWPQLLAAAVEDVGPDPTSSEQAREDDLHPSNES